MTTSLKVRSNRSVYPPVAFPTSEVNEIKEFIQRGIGSVATRSRSRPAWELYK